MTRHAAWAILGLLALIPQASPLVAAAPTTFTINVVSARDLGCTTDSWTQADLRVRVLVNDVPVLVTPEGSDQDEPLFAATATASAQLPATIAVEVEEGEPSGFFGFQTRYTPCVIGSGGATRATFTYNGEQALARTLRGDGATAAEAVLVVGTAAPAPPAPTATATSSSVTLQWATDASGQATGHRVANGGAGSVLTRASVSGNRATLSGLCDNTEHVLRVVRDTPTWRVSSADVHVTTLNVAPWPPALRQAKPDGKVIFDSRTTHDLAKFEVHAAPTPTFTPSSSTLRQTSPNPGPFSPYHTTGVPFHPTDAYALVRIVDTGGLAADSPAIAIDGVEHLSGTDLGGSCAPPPSGSAATVEPQDEAPADLRAEPHLLAAFEVKGDGVQVDAAPGGVVRLTVFFLNKGDEALDVTVAPAATAQGFETEVSVHDATLAPRAKVEATVTIQVPPDAVPGDVATAGFAISVRSGSTQASVPAEFNVRVVPGTADVAASAEAGSDAGLSAGVSVALAAGAGAAAVGSAAWLLRRDSIRFVLAVALYTRLAKSEVLDHPGRERLHQAIRGEPGICYSELRRESGMNTGALVHHLRAMERAGLVASRKEGGFRRFYPVGAAPALQHEVLHVLTLTPTQARVVELLREAPLSQGELAQRLGLSQQGTSHHVKSLERAGHIEAFHDGRVWRYKPAQASRVVRP